MTSSVTGALARPCSDDDRVVLADHLAEVAGGGQVVVQAAVGDQVGPAARDLLVDDPADVDARLADQIAPELHDDFGVAEAQG